MTREQRKKKILKKADQAFIECGFNVKAKDVVGKKFVISYTKKDNALHFGIISSFHVDGADIRLYPKFERTVGYNNVDVIVLKSKKNYSNNLNALHVFRDDPLSESFFDFI